MASWWDFITSPHWTKAQDDQARAKVNATKSEPVQPAAAKPEPAQTPQPVAEAASPVPKRKAAPVAETHGYADAELQLALQKRGHSTGWNNNENFKKYGDEAKMDELLGKHTRKAVSIELGRRFRGPITDEVRAELEEKMPEYAALRRRSGAAGQVAVAAEQLSGSDRQALAGVRMAESGTLAATMAVPLKPARSLAV